MNDFSSEAKFKFLINSVSATNNLAYFFFILFFHLLIPLFISFHLILPAHNIRGLFLLLYYNVRCTCLCLSIVLTYLLTFYCCLFTKHASRCLNIFLYFFLSRLLYFNYLLYKNGIIKECLISLLLLAYFK